MILYKLNVIKTIPDERICKEITVNLEHFVSIEKLESLKMYVVRFTNGIEYISESEGDRLLKDLKKYE